MNPIAPATKATFSAEKMAKSTLYQSEHLLVGLNCFEPGQEHAVHTHAGMDKLYQVVEGVAQVTLGDDEHELKPGELIVAPADIPHGVRNESQNRLVLLAVLAPAPAPRG